MNRYICSVGITMLFCAIGNTQSNLLFGIWVDVTNNSKMIFNENYSFSAEEGNGKIYTGSFSIQGNQLQVIIYGATRSLSTSYAIAKLTANELQLRGQQGILTTMVKKNNRSISQPARWRNLEYNRILAENNGIQLKESVIQTMAALVEFLLDMPLSGSEVEIIRQEYLKDFKKKPAETISSTPTLQQFLDLAYSNSNPIEVGVIRQHFYAMLYQQYSQLKQQKENSPTLQMIFTKIPVILYGPTNQLVISEQDIISTAKYLNFLSTLNGSNPQITVEQVRKEILTSFQQMPLDAKQALATATIIWKIVDYNWTRLSTWERQQYMAQQQQTDYSTIFGTNQHSGMTWDQYQMLSNMSLQMHATNLNIIENIGGTGNYWEVR